MEPSQTRSKAVPRRSLTLGPALLETRRSLMKKTLKEALAERRLVCDGAMGTQLMLAGLESGSCGEHWNLAHPERVLAIQKRYVEAGADCLITNTFGGSRIMLRRHGHADDLRAINQAGARIARE